MDIDFTDLLKIWLERKSDHLPLSPMEIRNQYQEYVDDTIGRKRGKRSQF